MSKCLIKALPKMHPLRYILTTTLRISGKAKWVEFFMGQKMNTRLFTTVYAHPERWCGGFNNEVQIGNDVCMFIQAAPLNAPQYTQSKPFDIRLGAVLKNLSPIDCNNWFYLSVTFKPTLFTWQVYLFIQNVMCHFKSSIYSARKVSVCFSQCMEHYGNFFRFPSLEARVYPRSKVHLASREASWHWCREGITRLNYL